MKFSIRDKRDGVVYCNIQSLRELAGKLRLKKFVVIGFNRDIFEEVYYLQSNEQSFRLDPDRFEINVEQLNN